MSPIIVLAIGVFSIYMIGNVLETRAHKPFQEPPEDLRIAYAPDLIQALADNIEYQQKEKMRKGIEEKRRIKEMYAAYDREFQDAKVKRWLEGNPVTPENPLTEKEQPLPLYYTQTYRMVNPDP